MYEAVMFQGNRVIRETGADLQPTVLAVFRQYYDPAFTGIGGSFPARMSKASVKTMMEMVDIYCTTDACGKVEKSKRLPKESSKLLVLLMAGQPCGYARPL